MNRHDRMVALVAAISCADVLLERMNDCIAGAMEGVEATRAQAQRDHDADMAAWNEGFAAGLLAARMFADLLGQHRDVLRAGYRDLQGYGSHGSN